MNFDGLESAIKQIAADEVQGLLGKALGTKVELKDALKKVSTQRKVELGVSILRNCGFADSDAREFLLDKKQREEERFTMEEFLTDALAPADAPILLPKIVSQIVREAVEPVQVLTGLLQEIRYEGATIEFPSTSALSAADIAPGQEYPANELDFAGFIRANIGKSGLQINLTDEILRYSMFDVVGLHLRAGGRAMGRLKEVKTANLINANGMTSFDNSGGTSINGSTTGRDFNLNGNSTLTIDDIFVMYADLVNAGFIPNTFLVNPMGWLIFARHSSLRAWAFNSGQSMYRTVSGSPGFVGSKGTNLGPSRASGTGERAINQQTTYAPHPNELFPAELAMVVSPYITYSSSANTTTIVLCDRSELGVLITDQPVTTERWDDPARDIQSIKMFERYGQGVNNEGEGITRALGVSTAKGFDWENLAYTPVTSGSTLPAIT